MSNKRITDLSELTTPTTDDVLPIVDIASNTTQKVQVGNLPTTTAVTNALATKQETLVSGTNIKTLEGQSLLGSGNIDLVKGDVGLGNVDNTSDANKPVSTATQTALDAKQDTLVSGTNIKTINSTSLLGSGDIVISANPSGVSGAIQFSNGSAFASDAANLFYDDTNKRLGIGTNTPFEMMQIGSPTNRGTLNIVNDGISPYIRMGSTNSGNNQSTIIGDGNGALDFKYNGTTTLYLDFQRNVSINTARLALGAKLGVRGSGTTSATTSLLVQNSAGTELLKVSDNGTTSLGGLSFNGSIVQGNPYFAGIVYGPNFYIVGGTANFGASSSANASAQLELTSTTKGFLPPRMTTTQKNAIASPAAGLVVYDTTLNKLCVYTTAWETITSL